MADTKMIKIYLYTRFERFWHWAQTVMIVMLFITGFVWRQPAGEASSQPPAQEAE